MVPLEPGQPVGDREGSLRGGTSIPFTAMRILIVGAGAVGYHLADRHVTMAEVSLTKHLPIRTQLM